MKRLLVALTVVSACAEGPGAEQYGFITTLGRDTVSIESVTRRGNEITSDEVDRFPRVRRRHSSITLKDDGSIERLVMDIHTPSEPENQRDRRVQADVGREDVRITKHDGTGTVTRSFRTEGGVAMAHVPQMYSLYELTFAAARRRARESDPPTGDTVRFRQFYIDREFDNFPLHRGFVRLTGDNGAEIRHDWLSGIGQATFDSADRMLTYNGSRTTYDVRVQRVSSVPDIAATAERFADEEAKGGGVKSLSVRDTTRARIGDATFNVDYGRPLTRGRRILGNVVRYNAVWRTGANAATQFTTSAPIKLGNLDLAAGTYTLWTVPRENGTAELIVNKQHGQWGTEYDRNQDLGRVALKTESVSNPVERFTITINTTDSRHAALVMEWGTFRWTAPIVID
jgi:hypothetical protein